MTSLRQVVLPDLVRPEDLAGAFGVTPRTASRWIRDGFFGPFARVRGRLVLRRESVLLALEEAEEDPRALRLVEARIGAEPGNRPEAERRT